jgi:hypothetical protein
VLIAAKSHVAAADVSRCFRDRLARKVYCALVFGHPSWEATQWEDRIMENGRRFKQRISGGGKAAQTDVVVGARGVLRVGQHAGREASLLWLFPHTGRRHQLRLHCSHHQHAIVGDATYAEDKLMYRMFLHAAALELPLERSDPLRVADPLQPHGWSHVFESGGSIHLPDGWRSEDLLGASSAVLGETVDGPKWAVAEAAEAAEGLTKVDGMRLMADKESKAFTTKAFTTKAFTTKAFTMEEFTTKAFTMEEFTTKAFTMEEFTTKAFTMEESSKAAGAQDQILVTFGKAAEHAQAEAEAEVEAVAEEEAPAGATAEEGRFSFHSMLTPGAVLAKAGLSGTTAAMLKPGVLVAKAGVTAP